MYAIAPPSPLVGQNVVQGQELSGTSLIQISTTQGSSFPYATALFQPQYHSPIMVVESSLRRHRQRKGYPDVF